MMNILIVDDDNFKIKMVEDLIKGNQIDIAKSYNSAMNKIISKKYDLIVLDMGLPTFDDGSGLKPDKGLRILSEMQRKSINYHVVVFSGSFYDTYEYSNVIDYLLSPVLNIKGRFEHILQIIKQDLNNENQ